MEIIIVDDFSTDNSLAVASELKAKYTQLINIIQNKYKGGNNARNFGFEFATGKYIQWLDADDILLPGKIRAQVEALNRSNTDIAYSSGFLETFGLNGELKKKEELEALNYNDYLLELLCDNWLPSHTYLLRYETAYKLYQIKAWNPATKAAQDREYFTKAAIVGAKFEYVPGHFFTYNRRLKDGSLSRKFSEKEKSAIVTELLQDFKKEIIFSCSIQSERKATYCKVLNTQMLYYCSLYDLENKIGKLSLSDIQWKLVKGYRSKLRMLHHILTN